MKPRSTSTRTRPRWTWQRSRANRRLSILPRLRAKSVGRRLPRRPARPQWRPFAVSEPPVAFRLASAAELPGNGNGRQEPAADALLFVVAESGPPQRLHTNESKFSCCNRVWSGVARLADGSLTVGEIAERLAAPFHGAVRGVVRGRVADCVHECARRGLIEWN